MRRALVPRLLVLACAGLVLAGCSRSKPQGSDQLSFETMSDTTGLSEGLPIVREFEPYRMTNGALRIRGKLDFPDGTLVQIAIKTPGGRVSLAMTQVTVTDRQFDSPPLLGPEGPLPVAKYRFEISTHFTSQWQPPAVLLATNDGRALRGPGITRTSHGGAAFYLVEEMKR